MSEQQLSDAELMRKALLEELADQEEKPVNRASLPLAIRKKNKKRRQAQRQARRKNRK